MPRLAIYATIELALFLFLPPTRVSATIARVYLTPGTLEQEGRRVGKAEEFLAHAIKGYGIVML